MEKIASQTNGKTGQSFLFTSNSNALVSKILFVIFAVISLWPRIDTAIALAAGIAFSLILSNPFPKLTGKWSKILLQLSIIGLGFGIGISQVISEGKHSIIYTIIGIFFTIAIGNLIGKLLKVNSNTSQLISFGTAICGGSAIAAMAPVLKAKDEETAVSLATIFALNSIALLLFPFVGHVLHLSQQSFGTWAALAIHDTSSVVGATASYGGIALVTGTTVKLTRALWITPVVLGYSYFRKANQKTKLPLFIIGFFAAALIRTLLPSLHVVWDTVAFGSRRLLVMTLFLIGSGLTKEVLKKVGFKPMAQGIALWLIVSMAVLILILSKIIR